MEGSLGIDEIHFRHEIQVGTGNLHLAIGLVTAIFGEGLDGKICNRDGLDLTRGEGLAGKGSQGNRSVRSRSRKGEGQAFPALSHAEVHICRTGQVHLLNHVQVGTGDGDDLAALIGRFRGLVHGGIPYDEFGRGIDLVRNRVRIDHFVHVPHDNIAGDGVGGDDELKLMTVLAQEFGHVHTAQDHFLHVVQVFTPDRDNVAGEDLRRSE